MAILSVAVTIVVTEITARLLKIEPIALLMLCAVISTAWLGGFGPAILAIALSLFAFYYSLVPPTNSFVWKHDLLHIGIVEVPRLFLFAIHLSLLHSWSRRREKQRRLSGAPAMTCR